MGVFSSSSHLNGGHSTIRHVPDNMSAEKQAVYLRFLLEAPLQQRTWLVKHITPAQVNAVGEVCYNILYGDIDVTKLEKYKHIIQSR